MQPETLPESLQGENSPLPQTPKTRETFLDALRGLALFGILAVNLEHFAGLHAYQSTHSGAPGVTLAENLITFFFSGKFYGLFSLLFGLGLALQYQSYQRRGLEPTAILRNRLLVLLAIGFLHGTFLFDGDILGLYALVGLFCLRYVGIEHRLWDVAKFLLAGWGVMVLFYWSGIGTGLTYGDYLAPSFLEVSRERLEFWLPNTLFGAALFGAEFVGLFLLGMWLAPRWQGLAPRTLWRVVAVGLLVGIPVNWVNLQYSFEPLRGLGGLAFALVYAALLRLFWERLSLLQTLSWAGRMPLTNYLTQSLLMSTLFYGYGFALYGQLHPLWFFPLALLVVAGQVAFSRWWLSRRGLGPAEWVWRRLYDRG
ncbi:MAG: DUF418 domain-containing protein [Meiothermus sp.]|nr:DUF418 domain-containing protein [Meiothermus sp.]